MPVVKTPSVKLPVNPKSNPAPLKPLKPMPFTPAAKPAAIKR